MDDPTDLLPPRGARRSFRQRLLLVSGVAAVCACLLVALGLGTIWHKWGQFERVDVELDETPAEDEPVNFLIVGSDSREAVDASDPNSAVFSGGSDEPSGQRADTIVVLRYDPNLARLDVLSVPRDLWVPISGKDTTDRINSAFAYEDGANTLIATVHDALGIPIHHYAQIDFAGFEDVVDEVGGVPMFFDTIYQDGNSGFIISDPGCVTLDGYMALALVRARHLQYMDAAGYWQTDPTGDLGRISRQQVFIRRILSQARGSLSLLRINEMNAMLDIGIDHVKLDEDLAPTELAAMGQRFAEFQGDAIGSHTLPVEPFTTNGGAAVVRLEEAAAQPVLNIFRGLPADHVEPSWIDLRILNGSGIKGQAGEVQEAFEAVGFTVSGVGDVPGSETEILATTRVRYAPGADALADLVERHLTAGAELVEDPELSGSEIVIETGADFTTVEQVPHEKAAVETVEDSTTTSVPEVVAPPTTTIGHVMGDPPEGVTCG